jgi:PAS domain-containing protein
MDGMTEGEINAPSGVSTAQQNVDIMYELDLNTGELKWNDKLYTVMGYPHTAAISNTEWWVDHIHPEDAMILNQAMDRLDDPSIPNWVVAYRFRNGKDAYVHVRDRASIVRDATGKAITLIGTITLLKDEVRGILP